MKNNMIWWIGLAVTHNIIFNWMIHFHLAFWHAFKCFQESFDGFENLKKKMIKSLCSIFFWQAWSGKLYRTNETNPFNVEYMQKKRMIIFYTISILCSCHYVIWYFSPLFCFEFNTIELRYLGITYQIPFKQMSYIQNYDIVFKSILDEQIRYG